MNIVVAGGTGFLGREITRALLDAGHQVSVASRSNPQTDPLDPRARWVRGDVTEPATLADALTGGDVVVDAVQFPNSPIENPKKGSPSNASTSGARRTWLMRRTRPASRTSSDSAASAPPRAPRTRGYGTSGRKSSTIIASGLTYTIFRPSWIYGERDVALNRFLGFAKFLPFIPVVGNGKTRVNPLFVGDLGVHVAAAVENEAAKGRMFEMGGPTVMTMDEVIRVTLKVAGKHRFLLHSPKPLMKLLAGAIQFAPGRPLTPDAVDFITMDGVADSTALTAHSVYR